ncbi:MAG: glycosyltransferase family 1 protein, partial [Anaerolineae bacterium]|nr:glycosyltransferase family 1 protein [Anaerolineae bacterium]
MSKPQTALIHPTGSPFTHHAALALAELGLLHEIVTTIAHRPAGSLEHAINLLPARMRQPLTRELRRRTWFSDIDANVQRHLWREVVRLTIVKSGLSPSLGFGATGPINWVYTALDQHVAHHHLHNIEAVYAYEDGAATTFTKAKDRNLFCFYDLPIMFYRLAQSIQAEEAARFPHLSSALQAVHEPGWKLARKEQEITLADHIFVASSITKRSLLEAGVPADKITVIPYGAPVDYFQPMSNQDHTAFRALFVGRVGPRKGVHYLLQAWQTLK